LQHRHYYKPSDQGYEKLIKERLAKWRGEHGGLEKETN